MSRELDKLVAEKVCKKCGSVRRMKHHSGYTQCLDCHNARTRAYQKTHRRRYPYNQTPEFKAYQRKWQLKRRYGITVEQYREMYDLQDGRCAICRNLQPGKHFAVDHCHATGIIRGLLCNKCNSGLANFRDDIEALEAAASYLMAFR